MPVTMSAIGFLWPLLNEGFRVSEVSDMLNFSASSYFAKCFKAEFGVNPKDFVQ